MREDETRHGRIREYTGGLELHGNWIRNLLYSTEVLLKYIDNLELNSTLMSTNSYSRLNGTHDGGKKKTFSPELRRLS